jgi:hypothetical protein
MVKDKRMKTRLIKNYVTTIIGLIILAICLFFIYEGKANAQDLSGWMLTGLLFLRSKDSLINLPPKE